MHLKTLLSRIGQTAATSLRALRRNKLRSALTALGVIIGVGSVVAMIAIGNGARKMIEGQVASLGSNMLTVFPGSRRAGGVNSGLGGASSITLEDAVAMQREVPDISAMSPEVSTSAQVVANGRNWATTVVGESPEYLVIRDWKMAAGTMFTDRDVASAARVAVIGSKVANELFGPLDPIGQTLRIKNLPFVVVGLLESKGAGMGGRNQDDVVGIPFTTAMRRLTGERTLRSVNLQVRDAARMDIAQQQITSLLRQRHRLAADKDDDFNVFNQKEIADTAGSITSALTMLLGAIGGISLVVGGIGIMNIMLVSVTERTREIGIRMAVGAQPGDIRLQFLIESVTLSLLGGLVGVLLGVGVSALVGALASFQPVVSGGSIVLVFCISTLIGVFFGSYPASRAAALDPIEALRFE